MCKTLTAYKVHTYCQTTSSFAHFLLSIAPSFWYTLSLPYQKHNMLYNSIIYYPKHICSTTVLYYPKHIFCTTVLYRIYTPSTLCSDQGRSECFFSLNAIKNLYDRRNWTVEMFSEKTTNRSIFRDLLKKSSMLSNSKSGRGDFINPTRGSTSNTPPLKSHCICILLKSHFS